MIGKNKQKISEVERRFSEFVKRNDEELWDKAKERIRELELRLADAHIIEMHPEHHGRCIKEINALKAERDRLKAENERLRLGLLKMYSFVGYGNTGIRYKIDELLRREK